MVSDRALLARAPRSCQQYNYYTGFYFAILFVYSILLDYKNEIWKITQTYVTDVYERDARASDESNLDKLVMLGIWSEISRKLLSIHNN